MKFSGIEKTQLIAELREYQAQLVEDVEFFACNVGWHGRAKLDAVKAELSAVCAFLAYLLAEAKKVAQRATNRAHTSVKRCPFYKSIRRFYAICQSKSFATDDVSTRALLSFLLGRTVESRKTLTANDWVEACNRAEKLHLAQ